MHIFRFFEVVPTSLFYATGLIISDLKSSAYNHKKAKQLESLKIIRKKFEYNVQKLKDSDD